MGVSGASRHFDPTMMTALLLYSYLLRHLLLAPHRQGRAARRVDFMSIVALDAPDFPHHLGFPQATLEGA